MHGSTGSNQCAVEGRNLHLLICRIYSDVHVTAGVVDIERAGIKRAFPTFRAEHLTIHKHHIVVEAVEWSTHTFSSALPPSERGGREQRFPLRPPDVVAQ